MTDVNTVADTIIADMKITGNRNNPTLRSVGDNNKTQSLLKNHFANQMASNVVKFADVFPRTMVHSKLASSAAFISKSVQYEYLPVAQTDYSYEGNDEIEFHVSSDRDFISLRNTILRLDLTCIGTKTLFLGQGTTDSGAYNDVKRHIEEGGIANLFRRIEITDRAGRQIDLIENYDRLSNILTNVYWSADHANYQEWMSGDSKYPTLDHDGAWCALTEKFKQVVGLPDVFESVTQAYDLRQYVNNGDDVRIVRTSDNSHDEYEVFHMSFVREIEANSNFYNRFRCTSSPTATGNVTDDRFYIQVRPRGSRNHAATPDATTLDTPGITLNMRLNTGFFSIKEDMPLFLLDGLRIKFTLREPRFAFNLSPEYTHNKFNVGKTLDYKIATPRLVAQLKTPSEEVRASYMSNFTAGKLNYAFPAYHVQMRQESGDEENSLQLDIPVAKSSVRRVFFVIQNERSRGATDSADRYTDVYTYPSKTYIDAGLSSYQFKIGGVDYPNRRVDVSDIQMSEAMFQLQKTFNVHNNAAAIVRIEPHNWFKVNENSDDGTCNEAHKAIFSTTFATIPNDPMTGLKTNGQGTDSHVIADLRFDRAHKVAGNTSTRYFDFYFEYTKVLHIGSDGIVVLD
jgi:hypothetical protein